MDFKQPLSTPPKLSLFSLPPTLPDGITPPPNSVATVPFLWEEAPGKPRPTATTDDDPPKSKIVRSLDLPPRLITSTGGGTCTNNNVRIFEVVPSPTTVLGGPYEAKSLLESPEISSKSKLEKKTMPLRKLMKKETSPVKFNSWRWEHSFRDMEGERSPTVKFCSWRWDSFRDMGSRNSRCASLFDDLHNGSKTGNVTRKNSFKFISGTTSRFLVSMCGTLKQAIPWRPRK